MRRVPLFLHFLKRRESFIVLCIITVLSLITIYFAISGAMMDSATEDEPAHITSGYLQLTRGVFDFYREQPPMMDALSALPLLLSGPYNFPNDWRQIKSKWTVGQIFLYRSGNDADRMLLLTRLPEIVLLMLLCFLLYAWVYKETGSHYYGLLGFVLTLTCPNLLAHGRLATSDIGLTFFIALASFLYLRFLHKPVMTNVFLTGVATGCALLSKVSGLILLPYFGILLLFFLFLEKMLRPREIAFYLSRYVLILAFALLCFEVFYLLEVRSSYLHYAYPQMADSLGFRLLFPFREYAESISAVYRWFSKPYDKLQFLMGKFSYSGWWYYYIVAFTLKTRIPSLLLFLWSLGGLVFICRQRETATELVRRNFDSFSLIVFIGLFFVVTLGSRVDIGTRYILPIYAFMFVFIPVSLSRTYSATRKGAANMALVAIVTLATWNAAISISSYPSYLGYFNSFIGSNRNADKYLIDSNLDWGQDLKRLAVWVERHNIPKIHLVYFGGGDPIYYLGSKVIVATANQSMLYFLTGHPGYYAVSRQHYRVATFRVNGGRDFDLSSLHASFCGLIGKSIYIFHVK